MCVGRSSSPLDLPLFLTNIPFPVLREHALFTLHNLLKNNPENQAVVDVIRPAAEFDDAGVLKNKFGVLKIN